MMASTPWQDLRRSQFGSRSGMCTKMYGPSSGSIRSTSPYLQASSHSSSTMRAAHTRRASTALADGTSDVTADSKPHATPVGSGTVARTQRIPIERRAEAAVIAWMRHQTTAYDSMKIARVKGQRREVRRLLAARSRSVLEAYRQGHAIHDSCPLKRALAAESPSPQTQ
jgi:hypothetical protein